MIGAFIYQRHPAVTSITPSTHHFVNLKLQAGIHGVQFFSSVIEPDSVRIRRWQIICQVRLHHRGEGIVFVFKNTGPVRREAGRAAQTLRDTH